MELFHYVVKNDYDHKVKIGGENILCYSAKRMKELHPDVELSSLLEASLLPKKFDEERAAKKKPLLSKLPLGSRLLGVVAAGSHLRIGYKRAGYICLADGRYVVLCVSRVPFLIILLLLLAALAVSVAILIGQLGPKEPPVIDPDHPLPPIDEGLVPEEGGGNAAAPEDGGGTVSMIYTLNAELTLSTGKIKMHFRNPKDSNHSVAVELYVVSEGVEYSVARSGLIPAGNGLYQMTLAEDAPALKEGMYTCMYRVRYYHPITGVRAIVESEITDVVMTVKS